MKQKIASVFGYGLPFVLIAGTFFYGIQSTLPLPENVLPRPEPEPVVEVVKERPQVEYLVLQNLITAEAPNLGGGLVQCKISLAMDVGVPSVLTLRLKEAAEPVIVRLSEILREEAIKVEQLNELYDILPDLFRESMNEQLGTPDMPEPIVEVLISSLLTTQ